MVLIYPTITCILGAATNLQEIKNGLEMKRSVYLDITILSYLFDERDMIKNFINRFEMSSLECLYLTDIKRIILDVLKA